MNPWQILGDVIGWVLLGALALVVVVFVFAVIAASIKAVRRPKRTKQIMKADRQ